MTLLSSEKRNEGSFIGPRISYYFFTASFFSVEGVRRFVSILDCISGKRFDPLQTMYIPRSFLKSETRDP